MNTKEEMDFPGGLSAEESACKAGDAGSVPKLGASGGGNSKPTSRFCS